MDKIKSIFTPSHKKDEEKFGDADARREEGVTHSAQTDAAPLHTTAESQKKEHGILRQVLNPGGEKYDQAAYGENATTADPASSAEPTALATDPDVEKSEHGVVRQLLDPHGAKYDELKYGTTAHASSDIGVASTGSGSLPVVDPNATLETDKEAKKHEHGILRQIFNPRGAKYDDVAFGTTAHAVDSPSHGDSSTTQTGAAPAAQQLNTAPVAPYSAAGQPTDGTAVAPVTTTWQPAYGASQSTSAASEVPAAVVTSQEESHTAPEAASNPAAVHEKSAVEQELLSRVPEAQAGSSAVPSTSSAAAAGGALGGSGVVNEETHIPSDPSLGKEAAAAVTGGGVAGGILAHEHNKDVAPTTSAVENVNQPTDASHNDVESATYTYSSTPVGIGAHGGQSGANSIANLHAAPVSADTGVIDDTPSVGIRHGHAVHVIAQTDDAGAISSEQVNLPRANNDIEDATHVVRSYPVGSAGGSAAP